MDTVISEFECPKCGNNEMDELIIDDNDTVHCTQCETKYRLIIKPGQPTVREFRLN
jgi:transcription elongation factor Elf1